jgi:serine protease
VAGTVGAALTNNGTGVAGGAWNVTVVPVRALGRCGGRLSDINDSIRWAAGLIPGITSDGREVWTAKRADIINMSLGLFERCPASMQAAIDEAVAAGSIVVAAAGNARLSTAWYAPAGCRNVVTVAAGDARGQITPYSNYGAEVDILAPGGDVTRDDDGDGRPDGVLSTKQATNCVDPVTGQLIGSCNYAYENGTSMAAPHVAAALALLKAEQPTATPDQLVSRLLASIRPRAPEQCAGECRFYPGTTPYAGAPAGMCARPCGAGLLDLSIAAAAPPGGTAPGGR